MRRKKIVLPKKTLADVTKILATEAGSVTYVFRDERYDISTEKNYVIKSHLVVNFNPQSFLNEKGKKKTPREFFEMLMTTRSDLKASYFIIG
jgi:hypothetical protein